MYTKCIWRCFNGGSFFPFHKHVTNVLTEVVPYRKLGHIYSIEGHLQPDLLECINEIIP